MLVKTITQALIAFFVLSSALVAQDTGMAILKRDVGAWDAEIRTFEPGSEKPIVSKGSEHVHMLGDVWSTSHFKGDMGGMPFEGASYTGYNAETKKFFGTWIDSMSNYPMAVEGTWDEKTNVLTSIGSGKGPDGTDMKLKMVTEYKKDGSRLFTMSMMMDDETEMKMMEILYTKAANQQAAPTRPAGAIK
jgi:hypothetical protein